MTEECQFQNWGVPTTGPMSTSALPPAPLPEWQERQFRNLITRLSEWRSDDHEDAIALCRSEIIAILDGVKAVQNRPADRLKLGDMVVVNENCPFEADWRNVKAKVVCLRIDPEGTQWASVIEGDQRHRGNGVYDGEATDFDGRWLSVVR